MSETSGQTVVLTEQNFEQEVLQSDQPVLVDFWAEWCGPCKILGPTIEELASEYDGQVKIAKLNVDEQRGPALQYMIRSIPTVMLFVDGEPKATLVGVQGKPAYKAELDKAIAERAA